MLTHAIPQLNTALAGRYTIERELGRGGMATVYLARDLRHDRHVAVKVLDPELGAVLGAERFLSEIRVTARLQHPNLLPLFDSGEAEGVLYYVMPYVDGESLRARIDREKQLPVGEVVRVAAALARALAYAHGHGVIHRDLKPENILLQAGQPVIADFGIALAISNAGGGRITQTGISLGTPQYMSPEQATGDRQLDGRTDIYSLGAVTYEMLTGEPPHTGSTAQAVIARVLSETPRPVQHARQSVPPHVAAAVDRAIAKLPADRFESADDFADALSGTRPVALPEGITTPAAIHVHAPRRNRWHDRGLRAAPWLVAASGIAVAAYALATRAPAPPGSTGVVRVTLALGDSAPLSTAPPGANVALAPDGSRFAYTTGAATSRVLAIRPLDDVTPRLLAGTEDASEPAFSPDDKSIVFRRGNGLYWIPVTGGPTTHIADLPNKLAVLAGMTWGDRGDIVFAEVEAGAQLTPRSILWRVPATGGVPVPVARGDRTRGQVGLGWPDVLPGSHAALVTIFTGQWLLAGARLGVVDLDDGKVTDLGIAGTNPHYVPPGYVVYALSDGSLMASRFDASRRRVTGPTVQVAQNIPVKFGGVGNFSVSATGAMLAIGGGTEAKRVLVTDRDGVETPLLSEVRSFTTPRVSPDGRRVALATSTGAGESAVWIYDRVAKTFGQLATDIGLNRPEWSPDGSQIYYVSWTANQSCLMDQGLGKGCDRPRRNVVVRRRWDGTGSVDTIVAPAGLAEEVIPLPDARHLVLREGTASFAALTLFTIDSARSDGTRRLPLGQAGESQPRVSPDGRWLAYVGNGGEARATHVYVRPLDGSGGRTQISVDPGSAEPVWSRDGHMLFYRSPTRLVAVTLRDGAIVKRDSLFADVYAKGGGHAGYDVMPDGLHFVMLKSVDHRTGPLLVVNWLSEVKDKLATNTGR